jgi:hypothetical protein
MPGELLRPASIKGLGNQTPGIVFRFFPGNLWELLAVQTAVDNGKRGASANSCGTGGMQSWQTAVAVKWRNPLKTGEVPSDLGKKLCRVEAELNIAGMRPTRPVRQFGLSLPGIVRDPA